MNHGNNILDAQSLAGGQSTEVAKFKSSTLSPGMGKEWAMDGKRAIGGFCTFCGGLVVNIIQGTHPDWFGNHTWILPASFVVLFVGLLFWVCQYRWAQRLLGIPDSLPRQAPTLPPAIGTSEITRLEEDHKEEIRKLEAQQTSDSWRTQEAYRQCTEEKKEYANRCLDYRAELAKCAEEKSELQKQAEVRLTIFSPLQTDAFMIAKDLREFLAGLPPFPSDPMLRPGEDKSEFMVRFFEIRSEKQGAWRQKLMHGYANRKFGERITALMHRAGEEVEYPAHFAEFAEKPPMGADDIRELAQQMEMMAIWINRKKWNEVNLLGEKRV